MRRQSETTDYDRGSGKWRLGLPPLAVGSLGAAAIGPVHRPVILPDPLCGGLHHLAEQWIDPARFLELSRARLGHAQSIIEDEDLAAADADGEVARHRHLRVADAGGGIQQRVTVGAAGCP